MNRVAPLALWSWMMPRMRPLNSARRAPLTLGDERFLQIGAVLRSVQDLFQACDQALAHQLQLATDV